MHFSCNVWNALTPTFFREITYKFPEWIDEKKLILTVVLYPFTIIFSHPLVLFPYKSYFCWHFAKMRTAVLRCITRNVCVFIWNLCIALKEMKTNYDILVWGCNLFCCVCCCCSPCCWCNYIYFQRTAKPNQCSSIYIEHLNISTISTHFHFVSAAHSLHYNIIYKHLHLIEFSRQNWIAFGLANNQCEISLCILLLCIGF